MFLTDDGEGGGDFKINKPIRETKALGEKRERERDREKSGGHVGAPPTSPQKTERLL